VNSGRLAAEESTVFDLVQHLRSAWRLVRLHPWFALVLSAGIAVSSGFTATTMTLARALTAPAVEGPAEPDGLIAIYRWSADGKRIAASPGDLDAVRALAGMVAHAGAATGSRIAAVRSGDDSAEARVSIVYGELFETLAMRAAEGRLITPADAGQAVATPVVVSQAFRDRRTGLGVGSRIAIDDVEHVVVGVAPGAFAGLELGRATDVWIPASGYVADADTAQGITIVARVPSGMSPAAIQRAAPPLAPVRFSAIDPEYRRRLAPIAFALTLAGAMVLAAGAIGIAALLISRNAERLDEIGTRAALGATATSLRTQLAVESGVLAVVASAGSAILAFWTLRLLLASLAPEQALFLGPEIALSGLIGRSASLLVIWIPACATCAHYVSRTTPALLRRSARSLRDSPIGLTVQRRLLVLQTALACALLIAVALLTRGFEQTLTAGLGATAARIAIVSLKSPGAPADALRATRFQRLALEQVTRLPGVAAAAWASTLPLVDGPRTNLATTRGGPATSYRTLLVSPAYFRTMQLDVPVGRSFEATEEQAYAEAIVVNAALASRVFPHFSSAARFFDREGGVHPVVGVAADGRYRQMEAGVEPTVFRPLSTEYTPYLHLIVRGTADASTLLPVIRKTLDGIDEASVYRQQSLQTYLAGALGRDRVAMVLVRACGGLVMLLSLSGAYLLAESIALRRGREMAVRLALGSTRGGLASAMIGRAVGPAVVGVCLGAVCGYAATFALRGLIGGLSGADLPLFGGVAVVVLALSLAATAIPALAAARSINPIAVLR